MNQSYTPPCTLSGISRLAKAIRRDRGIKHTQALEAAARIAGFESYKHAQRKLALAQPMLQSLHLTVYWRDHLAERTSGRCTAVVQLPEQVLDVLSSLKVHGRTLLGGFELESPDHLRRRLDVSSLSAAKSIISSAVRELQFCAATGLRRVRKEADLDRLDFLHELPGRDHLSFWTDESANGWVALDEPYCDAQRMAESERAKWLAEQGLVMTTPAWIGLHAPGYSTPYLIAKDSKVLQQITATVEQMPAEATLDWDTNSGFYYTDFLSPQRVASGKPYRSRPQPSYGERAGAIAYGGRPGEASNWRPAQAMTLEQHQALGNRLRGLARSDLSSPTRTKLTATLSLLDDWSSMEHSDTQDRILEDLYYRRERLCYTTPAEQLQGIREAQEQIVQGYNDCRPRRDLLKVLEQVKRDVQRRLKKELSAA
jgi:hypothetical protein